MNLNCAVRSAVSALFVIVHGTNAATLPSFSTNAASDATVQARAIIQTDVAPKVPGLAVAVAVDGVTVWSEGFGYADLAAKTPATPATRFRIGSVSKPLTAAGLALLIERGQLDLDAPLQKYIPDFPQKGGVITLRLLAGHLSGIRNYRGSEALSNKAYATLRSGLKMFEDDPLVSPPGTKFNYSSYNWNVLGVAIEAASKQNFLRFMQDNVFQSLGMTNTRPDLADVPDPARTQFYESNTAGTFVVAPKVDCCYKWPSGGFLSTAEDLVRFGSAHLRPGFLKPESRKLLFTSQTTADGTPTHHGVGWFVGRTLLYHQGDAIGGTSVLLLLPASRTAVAIVSNRGSVVFGSDTLRPVATQQTDLNMVTIAQKLANLFAPLSAKP